MTWRISLLVLLMSFTGCARRPAGKTVDVVVTNTLIEVAVRDLAGDQLTVMSLATPGMCPGHFDLKPSHIEVLRHAKVIGLFEFQRSLAKKLPQTSGQVVLIKPCGGLAVPATYLDLCQQMRDALAERFPQLQDSMQTSMAHIEQRLQTLDQDIQQQTAMLAQNGCPVLCSIHQEAFLRSLNCLPVDTFAGSDAETLVDIESALEAGQAASIRLVAANEPEGTALAQAMAEQLNVPMVVLGNFPAAGETFDDLVRRNVTAVLEGLSQ